jgi:glycogen synthase
MVQWLHDGDKSRQYKLPLHVLERIGVRSHRLLVAVSQGTAERLRALNPAAQVEVIGNGVERAAFAVPPCAGRDVVYVGRLEYGGKGLDLLLAAWAQVHRMVESDLVITGGGPDEDRVRREVDRLGLAKRVRFVGWVTGEVKWRLLAGARLAVVPSRHETFGMVALEALATATPVVAFDIPGLREVVPDGCGWRVPPFDVSELADRIRAACADPALAQAAGLAGRRFAAGFDWDLLADRQDEVYRSVLEEAAAR